MKDEYDFSEAKRGPVVAQKGKTRITMYLDTAVVEEFRRRADEVGKGYQTLINEVLKNSLLNDSGALEDTLRKVIREEIARTVS